MCGLFDNYSKCVHRHLQSYSKCLSFARILSFIIYIVKCCYCWFSLFIFLLANSRVAMQWIIRCIRKVNETTFSGNFGISFEILLMRLCVIIHFIIFNVFLTQKWLCSSFPSIAIPFYNDLLQQTKNSSNYEWVNGQTREYVGTADSSMKDRMRESKCEGQRRIDFIDSSRTITMSKTGTNTRTEKKGWLPTIKYNCVHNVCFVVLHTPSNANKIFQLRATAVQWKWNKTRQIVNKTSQLEERHRNINEIVNYEQRLLANSWIINKIVLRE